jgi:hypothetical protein
MRLKPETIEFPASSAETILTLFPRTYSKRCFSKIFSLLVTREVGEQKGITSW